MAKTKKTEQKSTPIEDAVGTIIKSIKRKSSGQKIAIDNLKFVIDDEPQAARSSNELLESDRNCRKWVCRFRNGKMVCGWEAC